MTNERKQAGANYIVNFFNTIQNLNHEYSRYINFMLEFKQKFNGENAKMEDSEKQNLNTIVQTVRYWCNKVVVEYKTILKVIKKDKIDGKLIDEIQTQYTEIRHKYVISAETLEAFVININAVLMADIIQDLLTSSKDLVSEIYAKPNDE